ncbi:type II secretion system GspH family protein [Ideonella azotifigens]|nr:prepilin-type N-terminal cleavage/methylation domain-containing protein [Ideonella azotifigens]MCD2343107.1 type II secretion system GspH family protein [Ideonella azotifigens]
MPAFEQCPQVRAALGPPPEGVKEAWGGPALPCGRTIHRHAQRGFTLIEAVMVIVLSGIIVGIVAKFIAVPVLGYLSANARANLADTADGALRRIGRELHASLPNSVRVNSAGTEVELIPVTAAARFMTEGSGALEFGVTDTDFDLMGPPIALAANQWFVVYNLGAGITGSDAYAASSSAADQAASNRRSISSGAGSVSHLTIASAAGLPVSDYAAPFRGFVVNAPVTFRCDLSAGTLTRYSGYGFNAAQPDPPSGGSSALLASGVTACQFSMDAVAVAARAALVSLRLQLSTTTTSGTETVSLHHAVHIDNLP